MSAHTRAGDPANETVILRREIPLWGVITAVGTVVTAVGAVGLALWIQMQAVLQEQRAQASNQTRTTQQLDTLLERLSASNIKDKEHDILIANIQVRVSALEAALPRQLLNIAPTK